MSPFRSGKKNSPNGHHPQDGGSQTGSLLRPKTSSLRKNNSNSDILSSSSSTANGHHSLKKSGSVSQNSLNRSGSTGRRSLVKGAAVSASEAANFKVPSENTNVRSLSR